MLFQLFQNGLGAKGIYFFFFFFLEKEKKKKKRTLWQVDGPQGRRQCFGFTSVGAASGDGRGTPFYDGNFWIRVPSVDFGFFSKPVPEKPSQDEFSLRVALKHYPEHPSSSERKRGGRGSPQKLCSCRVKSFPSPFSLQSVTEALKRWVFLSGVEVWDGKASFS